MTRPVDPAVQQAHADVVALFRTTPAADPAGLYAVCRAARDRLAALPVLDPHDPGTWNSYELLTTNIQTLLCYLGEAKDTLRRCELWLGSDDSTTILATQILAASLSGLGEHRIALSLYVMVHQWRLLEYGEDALTTLGVAENIALALQELGDHDAARAVDADLLPRFERAAGKDYVGSKRTRNRLEKTLRALGRDT